MSAKSKWLFGSDTHPDIRSGWKFRGWQGKAWVIGAGGAPGQIVRALKADGGFAKVRLVERTREGLWTYEQVATS